MPLLDSSLQHTRFTLDASGVTGFFGGDEATSTMVTVHLFRSRIWLGWYNLPGSYIITKRFGQLAVSRFWDRLFPGLNGTSAVSFGLEGRKTALINVAFLELKDVKHDEKIPQESLGNALVAFILILISFVAFVMCAMVAGWFCFSIVLFGVISSSVACLVIGFGERSLNTVKDPAADIPSGNGMPITDDTVIVVKGAEKDMNAITKDKFLLKIGGGHIYDQISFCSLLLVEFLLQLFLISQGSLFAQTMFLRTLGVSWAYNSYSSLLEKEKIQAEVLFKKLGRPKMEKFCLWTRTTMTVFTCLVCCGMENLDDATDPEKIFQHLILKNTDVWRRWRSKVTRQMKRGQSSSESLEHSVIDQDDWTYPKEGDTDAKSASEDYRKYLQPTERMANHLGTRHTDTPSVDKKYPPCLTRRLTRSWVPHNTGDQLTGGSPPRDGTCDECVMGK